MRPPCSSTTRARPRASASGLMWPPVLFQKPPNQASDPSMLRGLVAGQQFDRRAEFRPLPHPPLGDLDASRRMHRLHPAGLFLLGLDLIAPATSNSVEALSRSSATKRSPDRAVLCDDILGVGPRQGRDHLSVVASRGAPARLHGLDDGDIDAGFAQMQRGRQSGETAADDDDVGLRRPDELRQLGTWRRRRGPQRIGPADICASSIPSSCGSTARSFLAIDGTLAMVGLRTPDRSG